MSSGELLFREEDHSYWIGDRRILNVSTILSGLTDYSWIAPDALKRAQEEGKAVHRLVELDCKDDLDVAALPEWMRGHYAAWCRFKDETGFEVLVSEERVHHRSVGYAGTLDLLGAFTKMRKVRRMVLIDIKRSFYAGRSIGYQTAAYAAAWKDEHKASAPIQGRFALRLDANGKYHLRPFDEPSDFNVFLACLTILKARLTLREENNT